MVGARPASVRLAHAERRARQRPRAAARRRTSGRCRARRRGGRARSCSCSTTSTSCATTRPGTRWRRSPPQLPDNVTVAMASRRELPIPLARLRAEGLVSELREGELALTRAETATLLRGAGLRLARDDVDAVFRATEGWPAALVARRSRARRPTGSGARRGALRRRRPARRGLPARRAPRRRSRRTSCAFVRRSVVLDVLTAPACDRVLERSDSAAVISPPDACRLPARGARPHRRALPAPSPAERVAARGAGPHRRRPRSRAAPPRERVVRGVRRSRARR